MAKSTQKVEAVPVKIPLATYNRLKTYKEVFGVPIVRIIDRAMAEWMDVVGDLRLETISKGQGRLRLVPVEVALEENATDAAYGQMAESEKAQSVIELPPVLPIEKEWKEN